MPDYGHDLLFGTFVTPDAAAPDRVLGLARLTDALGLDLVTVQDHPYQPRFLEAWTLLSVIAASTHAVRVVPNVANLPLRPPAALARAAASLDLLSGGRVELGLGAGAFWDAIAANGGPRRSAGEAVEALEEAIAVIRGLWAADGAVRLDGVHYPVAGAKAGPAPAHHIGIWVGAYKPRMLGLVGRLADGWLPSLGYVQPDELAGMNARIDEAADAAGRAPTDVRRLFNVHGRFAARGTGFLVGPAEQWAEDLAGLALADGISGFVLGGDDPDDVRRFAEEVVPAVRELVGVERERAQRADDVVPSGPAAGPSTPSTPSAPSAPSATSVTVAPAASGVRNRCPSQQ